MATKRLPSSPDLGHLKHQARDLRNDQRAGKLDSYQRIREFHPGFSTATDAELGSAAFTLADAHLAIAREYGFASWARLRRHVAGAHRSDLDLPRQERIQDGAFRRAVDLLDDGDVDGLRSLLAMQPALARQRVMFEGDNYFRDPALLEFVAENPVRHESLPPNIVELARVILDAGARLDQRSIDSTLSLVCSGRVPRECGLQAPLIGLLCDYGADRDGAMLPAVSHGEFEAVEALIRRGATLDLVVAAATGRIDDARRTLSAADGRARHRALALAAQHGHSGIVALLLDAGEDPDRYNPVGCHAHSTPLHQAALAGHEDAVRVLVERGARLDLRDVHWHATPLQWAEHGGHGSLAGYLRARGATLLGVLAMALVVGCVPARDASVESIVSPFLGPGLGGVAIAVVRDGNVVAKKGFGPADIEGGIPVTSETVFDLASASKQFTGIAVLLLAQRGELSMDDDVRAYVPEVPSLDPRRPIRLDDLSRHVSGLPEFPRAREAPTEADVFAWLATLTALEFPPGERWAYRNLNYFLLGRVVERVSGRSLGAFLEEQVFTPAGMATAQVIAGPAAAIRNRATGYCFGKPCRDDYGVTGAGGVVASLEDMIAWDRALAAGTIVTRDALLEALEGGYAFGWGVAAHDGHRMMWHDGDSTGASVYVARYLDTPLTVVVLSNQTRLEVEALERSLAALFLPAAPG